MTKQRNNPNHLRLIKSFDDEAAHEARARKARQECDANTTVIDGSSNMSSLMTCLDSVLACERAIASVENDAEMSETEKEMKLSVLNVGLNELTLAAHAFKAACLHEIKHAA